MEDNGVLAGLMLFEKCRLTQLCCLLEVIVLRVETLLPGVSCYDRYVDCVMTIGVLEWRAVIDVGSERSSI